MSTHLKELEENLKKAKDCLGKKYTNCTNSKIFVPEDIKRIGQNKEDGILIGHGIVFQGKMIECYEFMDMELDDLLNDYTQCTNNEVEGILTDNLRNMLKFLDVK